MLFTDGYTTRTIFITYINDNNAMWVNTVYKEHPTTKEKFPIHHYLSVDGNRSVIMAMPEEDIPKRVAKGWLYDLGIKR